MSRCALLVGAGHAHAQVLLAWAQRPVPGVRLVVVSPHAQAPYSGMVPGWLAGQYRFDEIVIDFARLCERAGAEWRAAALQRLDPVQSIAHLDDGTSIHYEVLSLNVGSALYPPTGAFPGQILSMRPLAELHSRYGHLLDEIAGRPHDAALHIAAVGGGAAGVESLLAVVRRLRALDPRRPVTGTLLTRHARLLAGYPAAARQAAGRALQRAGITVQLQTPWHDGMASAFDRVLWATGAQPHDWQRHPDTRGPLAVSASGFVQVNDRLQSVSHPRILAVGDCAHWQPALPKAGVYAVRMGPVLIQNLYAQLAGQPLQAYVPQNRFLSLLATADGQAIAAWGRWSATGRWAGWLKDHIDRTFIQRFAG